MYLYTILFILKILILFGQKLEVYIALVKGKFVKENYFIRKNTKTLKKFIDNKIFTNFA